MSEEATERSDDLAASTALISHLETTKGKANLSNKIDTLQADLRTNDVRECVAPQ